MTQKACQKWGFSAMVLPMQKKQKEKRTFKAFFMFTATVILTGSVLPVMADGTLTPATKELHVYTVSSSDSEPLETLKTQMIAEKASTGVSVDAASSTLTAIGFDRTKTGIQSVTLNLSTGKDSLSTTYTETAAVKVDTDTNPAIQLSTDTVNLNNGDTWNASSYIKYLYDETGKLPTLKITGNVDTSTDGTYSVSYTVIDLEGRSSKQSLTVNVTTPEPTPEELAAEAAAEAEAQAEQAAAEEAARLASIASTAASSPVSGTTGANPYSGGWSNCTYGAWEAVYENLGISLPSFGNASSWVASAQAYGYATGGTPRAGSVAVYYGHVAYVSAVSADGTQAYIIEGGYCGHYNERWISASGTSSQPLIGYIYF